MTRFLVVAVVATVLIMGLIGGWLLPRLGVHPPWSPIIAAAIAGALVATLYARMVRRPGV